MKIGAQKFKTRIAACWQILTRKQDHWALLSMDFNNLLRMVSDEDCIVQIKYHGTLPYLYDKMIKKVAENKDEFDMMLEKAEFEAASEEYKKKNNLL